MAKAKTTLNIPAQDPDNQVWLQDRIYGKVMNLGHPGQDIPVNINGEHFNYEDGQEGSFPRAIKLALDDTVQTAYRPSKDRHKIMESFQKRRYAFIEMQDPTLTQDELAKEIVES